MVMTFSCTRGNRFFLSSVAYCHQVPNGHKTAARAKAKHQRPGHEDGRWQCHLACFFYQKIKFMELLPLEGQEELLGQPTNSIGNRFQELFLIL